MNAHPSEMIEELIQEIVDDFDERGWLECEYRPDLTSEAACRAVDQLALVTIWDEEVISGTLRYRTLINNEIIAKRLSDVVPPGTSAFEEIKRAISDRVEAAADARLRDDVMRLQRPPSQFCRSAGAKADSDTSSPERDVINGVRQAIISWAVDRRQKWDHNPFNNYLTSNDIFGMAGSRSAPIRTRPFQSLLLQIRRVN